MNTNAKQLPSEKHGIPANSTRSGLLDADGQTTEKQPTKMQGLCPICGVKTYLQMGRNGKPSRTTNGRLIGDCLDAFTVDQWEAPDEEPNTNAKHTPGPWQFAPGHDPHNQAQIYGEDGKTLAITFADEGSANAALIAAAPALLDSLSDLVGGCGKEGDLFSSKAMDKARAAIAQAEGGAQ